MTDPDPNPATSKNEVVETSDNGTGAANPPTVGNAGESSSGAARETTTTGETKSKPLKRFDTLPTRRHQLSAPDPDAPRPRGRTLTGQTSASDPAPKKPLRRGTSIISAGRMGVIPERGAAQNSQRPRTSSAGLRPRLSTGGSRPRGLTLQRRPTVALAATGVDTGADNFTLSGPAPVEAIVGNQPYVDSGYAYLNPAYDQPDNVRPVWGLAKPLPRVVRPGMIPSRSEINQAQQLPPQGDVDVEMGRIEPTLNLNKITTQLQNTRQQRENALLEAHGLVSPTSPQGVSNAEPLTAASQVIEEEPEQKQEFLGVAPPLSEDRPVSLDDPLSQNEQTDVFPGYEEYTDDAASAITQAAGEQDLDGDWLNSHEIPLTTYDNNYNDEIHNLHTRWSVIRLRFREPLAELLAVTCQLTLGFCADLVVVTSGNNATPAGNEVTTDWAWGLATMIGIYIAGGISGAHLNPAISIMLWIYRGFPLRKVPMYILAQILGAFLAALIAFGIHQRGIIEYGGADLSNGNTLAAFITYPRYTWINPSTAFFTEFTGTAILAIAVLALGDDMNAPPGAGMSAFILGLVIVVLSMAFGYNTGAALNPSRDLGPRLAVLALGYGTDVFTDVYWIWGNWCAPIAGAIFGAFLYDAAIFAGGESPVNYPRKRIKRAGHKWKTRWGQRFRKMKPRKKNNGDGGLYGDVNNGFVKDT